MGRTKPMVGEVDVDGAMGDTRETAGGFGGVRGGLGENVSMMMEKLLDLI